jgi:hypothetical protein
MLGLDTMSHVMLNGESDNNVDESMQQGHLLSQLLFIIKSTNPNLVIFRKDIDIESCYYITAANW